MMTMAMVLVVRVFNACLVSVDRTDSGYTHTQQ